jgi:hypothetical protein
MGRARWWKSFVALLGVTGVAAGLVVAGATPAGAATGSTFVPLAAKRILDTRSTGPAIGANATRALQVAGLAGIPTDSTQVSAVVANVTVTGPTAPSFLTVYPAGTTRPTPSNIDFTAGETVANLVITALSSTGTIDIYNHVGTVNVIVDVTGYYTEPLQGTSSYDPLTPTRILDTRAPIGEPTVKPIGAAQSLRLQVEGVAGVPENGVSAVVLNVTALNSTLGGDLIIYPDNGSPPPATSNVNFAPKQTVANLVVVPMPTNTTSVRIFNAAGSTDVLADVVGYYTTGAGAEFNLLDNGLLDTRTAGAGGVDRPLVGGTALAQQVTGLAGVPADGSVTAVVLHVTVTNPTAAGFLIIYPDGTTRPTTSNLNAPAKGLVSNTTIVPVGADGKVDFFYQAGTTDLVVTVQGYFSA